MKFVCMAVLLASPLSVYADAIGVNLGTADTFAVLAGSTITNTGPSSIDGNVGASPGTSITGFPPGTVALPFTLYAGGPVASQAETDLATAYNFSLNEACPGTNVLTGQDLGGLTLLPGVYCFASSAQLTGTLTLNAEGDPNAVFLFQIESTLTTATDSAVTYINGGQGGDTFWQVGSSATIGTSTAFAGNILALTSITLNTDADIQSGSALAINGAVTLDTNDISAGAPEPSTAFLLLFGAPALLWLRRSRALRNANARGAGATA